MKLLIYSQNPWWKIWGTQLIYLGKAVRWKYTKCKRRYIGSSYLTSYPSQPAIQPLGQNVSLLFQLAPGGKWHSRCREKGRISSSTKLPSKSSTCFQFHPKIMEGSTVTIYDTSFEKVLCVYIHVCLHSRVLQSACSHARVFKLTRVYT